MRTQALVKLMIALLLLGCFWPVTQGWRSKTTDAVFTMSTNPLGRVFIPKSTSRYLLLDVSSRRLSLYVEGKVEKSYTVAVGTRTTPTPIGDFKVINKDYSWGGGFGTRWMGLNVPWGIYGIHGTNNPGSIGSRASHGCIRMHNRQVEELFPLVPVGTPVIIINSAQQYPVLRGRNLRRGMSGQDVVYLQRRLKEIGFYSDMADGRYGIMTELTISYFQFLHGHKPTGVMDRATYQMLQLPIAPKATGSL